MNETTRNWYSLNMWEVIIIGVIAGAVVGVSIGMVNHLVATGPDWMIGALGLLACFSLLAALAIYGFGSKAARRVGKIVFAEGALIYATLGVAQIQSYGSRVALLLLASFVTCVIIALLFEARMPSESTEKAKAKASAQS